MSKFDDWEREARSSLDRWENLPESGLLLLASRCGNAEIDDLITRIECLSQHEDTLPAWDGDSIDDLRRRQLYFGTILSLMASYHLDRIARGLRLESPMSRVIIALSLEKRGRSEAEPLLAGALLRETDETARFFIEGALGRLRSHK